MKYEFLSPKENPFKSEILKTEQRLNYYIDQLNKAKTRGIEMNSEYRFAKDMKVYYLQKLENIYSLFVNFHKG